MSGTGAEASLPWRGPGSARPDLAIPPDRMRLRSGGSWRKQWRYVAAFGEELMICAARVGVGPFGQSFWAVYDRGRDELLECTRTRPPISRGEVWTELRGGNAWELGSDGPDLVTRVESDQVRIKLTFGAGTWVESICPTEAGSYVWTRKRVESVHCELHYPDGRRIQAELEGIEDESAGYHPRHTAWSWSAGIGRSTDDRRVGWNLVEGVNDPATSSERAIWVEGEAREPAAVSFEGLEAVRFEGGERLLFEAEAERHREENRLLVRYNYRQPFGRFSGNLDGIELASGLGVMEHHDAWW